MRTLTSRANCHGPSTCGRSVSPRDGHPAPVIIPELTGGARTGPLTQYRAVGARGGMELLQLAGPRVGCLRSAG